MSCQLIFSPVLKNNILILIHYLHLYLDLHDEDDDGDDILDVNEEL